MPMTVARTVEAYLDHLTVERGLSRNTLSSYRRDLNRYVDFLIGSGVDQLADISELDFSAFAASLRTGTAEHSELRASSAARAIVAVRGLHRFAMREGL